MPPSSDVDAQNQAWRSTLSAALAVGVGAGFLLMLSTLMVETAVHSSILLFAATLPILLFVDGARMVAFHWVRPTVALLIDSAWLLVQLSCLWAFAVAWSISAFASAVAWCVGASMAAVISCVVVGTPATPTQGLRWMRTHLRQGGHFSVDFLSGQGVNQFSLFALAAVAAPPAVAAIKITQVALGPIFVASLGLRNVVTPLLARKENRDRHATATRVSLGLAFITLIYGAILWSLPEDSARGVFGPSWPGQGAVLILLTGQAVVAVASNAFSWVLRVRQDSAILARTRFGVGLTTLAGVWLLGHQYAAPGAAAALLVGGTAMGIWLVWRSLSKA